jgi:hypothetical protein
MGGAVAAFGVACSGKCSPTIINDMRIADQLVLKPISEAADALPPGSELVVSGVPTGKRVSGAILEGAVEWDSFHLLFLSSPSLGSSPCCDASPRMSIGDGAPRNCALRILECEPRFDPDGHRASEPRSESARRPSGAGIESGDELRRYG